MASRIDSLSGLSNGVSSLTLSSLSCTGAQRAIAAFGFNRNTDSPGTLPVMSVTAGAQSMTNEAGANVDGPFCYMEGYYIGQAAMAAATSQDVVFTWADTTTHTGVAFSLNEVADQAPESSNTAQGSATALTFSDDTITDDAIAVGWFGKRNDEAHTLTGDLSNDEEINDAGTFMSGIGGNYVAGAAPETVDFNVSWSTGRQYCVAIMIFEHEAEPAGGGVGVIARPPMRRYRKVGRRLVA